MLDLGAGIVGRVFIIINGRYELGLIVTSRLQCLKCWCTVKTIFFPLRNDMFVVVQVILYITADSPKCKC